MKINLSIHQETVLFGKKDINKQSATLYVPKDIDKIIIYNIK